MRLVRILTIDGDHLAVQVDKRTQAKVSVLEDGLDAHLVIKDIGNKSA